MEPTIRNIVLSLLAAYQNPDVDESVREYISDIARKHPDVIPDDLRPQVQAMQLAEVAAFFASDPTTWHTPANRANLARNIRFVLDHQASIPPETPEASI